MTGHYVPDLIFQGTAYVAGFTLLTVLAGALVLALLRRLQLRQHAYEDAPQTHQVKTGTPTMGGIVFLAPLLAALAVNPSRDDGFMALLFLVVACGLVGFADDYMSIVRGKNLGLRARTKFLATALVAIVFLRWINDSFLFFPRDTILRLSFVPDLTVPHWLWLVLGIIAITGTIHALNLTDGLDGLATGTVIPPLIVLFWCASQVANDGPLHAHVELSRGFPLLILAILGGCFGFLFYNRHPAKMFMGDTGSLALGALLAGAAILSGQMLLLVLIGGVFVAEALSVIVQVTYFKRTKKRIFRMSPLHHHFELGGWPETKVTTRFWLASAALSALGLAVVR